MEMAIRKIVNVMIVAPVTFQIELSLFFSMCFHERQKSALTCLMSRLSVDPNSLLLLL